MSVSNRKRSPGSLPRGPLRRGRGGTRHPVMTREWQSERLQRFSLPTAALSMDLAADGQSAYVGTLDGVWHLDLASGESRFLYRHDSYVSGVVYLAELGQLVSAGYDGRLLWWDLESGEVRREVDVDSTWIWDLAGWQGDPSRPLVATVTGQYLAGDYEYRPQPADGPTVKVWDAATGQLVAGFDLLPPVQAVALSPCGTRVAAANLMGDIMVGTWDGTVATNAGGGSDAMSDAEQQPAVRTTHTPDFTAFGKIKSHCQIGGIYAMTFSPDGQELLVAGMGPMVDPMAGNGRQRWQRFRLTESGLERVGQSQDDAVGEGLMEALSFHPEGQYFVMSGRLRGGNFNTALFDGSSGDLLHGFKSDSRVTAVRFSGSDCRIVLAGALNQSRDPEHAFGVVDVFQVGMVDPESADG